MEKFNLSDLPCYSLSIDPTKEGFVHSVAVTDDPAHQSLYLAFKADKIKQTFAVNDVKQEIFGAAIIPNQKIIRDANSLVKEVHTVIFDAEQIRIMAKEFFKQGFHHNINMNHTDEKVSGYFFQSGIVGDDIGNIKVNGLDLPNGTWVLGAKLDDLEVFNKVKTYGFSVEGLFNYAVYNDFKSVELSDEQLLEIELSKLLKRINKA